MVKAEDLMTYENQLLAKGYKYICGVDEVGRGPLAGPVCVAAVIMPMDNLIQGINDSKKVAKAKREKLYEQIKENAIAYSIQMVDNFKIDEINILNATKQAMHDAICSLKVNPDIVLIDAVKLDIPFKSMSIIHGDALSYSIGAASILAKVTRDRIIKEIDEKYPEYNFKKNKGYGTKEHIEAIKKYGICDIHRKSFCKKFV